MNKLTIIMFERTKATYMGQAALRDGVAIYNVLSRTIGCYISIICILYNIFEFAHNSA